jgi:MFS family permease
MDEESQGEEARALLSDSDGADDEREDQQEPINGDLHGYKSSRSHFGRLLRNGWAMKECLLVVYLFWSCQWIDTDIAGGFYRSIMACETPIPSESGECPTGASFEDGACIPVPRGEAGWSGSAHCFDQDYVVKTSTQFGGRISALATVGQLLSTLFVGTTLIDTVGRKPVMVMAMLGWCCLCGMFAIASHLKRSDVADILPICVLLVSVCNSFSPASTAMASDLSATDEVERSIAMTLVHAVRNAGTLSGFVGGFFILKSDLEDYNGIWMGLCVFVTAFALLAMVTLRETIPVRRFSAACLANRCLSRSPSRFWISDIGAAFRVVWRDPYLRYTLIPSHVLGGAGAMGTMSMAGGWGMSICGYSQEMSSVMGIVQPGMILVGSLSSAAFVTAMGPYLTGIFGSFLVAMGLFATSLGAFFRSQAPLFWWLGFGILSGFGQGIIVPCINGIASSRVGTASEQGKLFAVSTLSSGAGTGIGLYTFSNLLFTNGSDDSSLELASGWLVGAALMVVTLIINLLAYVAFILPERDEPKQVVPKKEVLTNHSSKRRVASKA